jgi:hypothetical protein
VNDCLDWERRDLTRIVEGRRKELEEEVGNMARA